MEVAKMVVTVARLEAKPPSSLGAVITARSIGIEQSSVKRKKAMMFLIMQTKPSSQMMNKLMVF
jgi:hypothetical protein